LPICGLRAKVRCRGWATLPEHKWSSFGERRGSRGNSTPNGWLGDIHLFSEARHFVTELSEILERFISAFTNLVTPVNVTDEASSWQSAICSSVRVACRPSINRRYQAPLVSRLAIGIATASYSGLPPQTEEYKNVLSEQCWG